MIISASEDTGVPQQEQIVQSRSFLLSIAERLMSDALRSQLTASDVVQQTLVAAIRDQHTFRGSSTQELTQWLVQILKHRIIDEARRLKLKQRLDVRQAVTSLSCQSVVDKPSALSDLVAQETVRQLLDAIEQLDSQQQFIVRSRYIESLSFEQIGQKLSLSHDAVRRLWLKAMQALGQHLNTGKDRE